MDADSVKVCARRTCASLERSGVVVHGNRAGHAQSVSQMEDSSLGDLAQRDVKEDGKDILLEECRRKAEREEYRGPQAIAVHRGLKCFRQHLPLDVFAVLVHAATSREIDHKELMK